MQDLDYWKTHAHSSIEMESNPNIIMHIEVSGKSLVLPVVILIREPTVDILLLRILPTLQLEK